MTFESLVLSCIKEGIACEKHICDELRSIGVELDMEFESVYEADFWRMAQEYFASGAMAPDPPTQVLND